MMMNIILFTLSLIAVMLTTNTPSSPSRLYHFIIYAAFTAACSHQNLFWDNKVLGSKFYCLIE